MFPVLTSLLVLTLNRSYLGSCQQQQEPVCRTPGCVAAAKEIFWSLDRSVNPCDNFYRFACGNAINNINLGNDHFGLDKFSIIENQITVQVRTILNEPLKENDIRPIALVKKYYQACMNGEAIEKKGQKIFTDLFRELGGWPVLEGDSWNDNEFHWAKLMAKLGKRGIEAKMFVELAVEPDLTNSSVRIVQIDQPSLGLPREYLITGTKIEPYWEFMVNISVQLGADKQRAEKELRESLDFELKLAKASLSNEARRNISAIIQHITIDEMQKNYPHTPWLEYINSQLPSEVHLKGSDVILLISPTYFAELDKLIGETPKRVMANYALFRAMNDLTRYSNKDVYAHVLDVIFAFYGRSQRSPRWNECIQETTKSLPLLVSSLYVRKFFDEDARKNVLEIVKYLKDVFIEILKTLDWMDNETQQKALEKAEKIIEYIAYPDELLNDEILDKYFEKLEIDPEEYLKSHLNIQLHKKDFNFKRLNTPVDKTDWTDHGESATAQATYKTLENSIVFAAGILQGQFFNKNRPRYMNFAAIGSIIGHEITHGFDDTGRQFDVNGNLANWWDPTTEKSFLEKIQCMIKQYGNYFVPEVNLYVNGNNTLGENIADNGGFKEAYLAYKNWVKANGPEPKLPDLNYSPEQLFWISGAMNWCSRYRPEYLLQVVATNTHSPDEFRVVGAFSNSKEFASDFNCPLGSKMNPVHKCAIW